MLRSTNDVDEKSHFTLGQQQQHGQAVMKKH